MAASRSPARVLIGTPERRMKSMEVSMERPLRTTTTLTPCPDGN